MAIPVVNATIAASGSLSSAVNLGGGTLAGVIMPSAWTTANITLVGSPDGVTYYDLYDIYGSEITIVGTAWKLIPTGDVVSYLPISHLKIRSGTGASAVTQSAERIVGLIVRNIQ